MSGMIELSERLKVALDKERARWRELNVVEWNIFGPDEAEERIKLREVAFCNGRIDALEQAVRELNIAAIHPFVERGSTPEGTTK